MKTNQIARVPEGQPNAGQFCAPDAEPVKGLHVYILQPSLGNSSNGGLSSRCASVTLVGETVSGPFEPDDASPAVKLVKRVINGEVVIHAEPVQPVRPGNIGYMAGGAFIHTSDSRFGEALRALGHSGYCAISLHDRQETQETYDALTR